MEATRNRLESSATWPATREAAALRPAAPAASVEPRPKRRWGRILRWTIGGAMLAEAAWLLMPMVLYRTSVRASVTAPLATVRIHQPGVVSGTPPEVGTQVAEGQPLFELRAASLDLRPSDQIEGQAEAIGRSIAALTFQIAEMEELKATLRQHFQDYQDARVQRAETQLAEQQAEVRAAESRLQEAEYAFQVHGRALIRAASSDIERSRSEHARNVCRDELEVARQCEARLQMQLDAARRGYFVGEADGGQDRVASLQRCDEIELQQAALRARLGELDGRLLELNARRTSEERHLAERHRVIVAPTRGVVWSSELVPGAEVAPGMTALEIADPSRLGLEAIFKEADAVRVRPGAAVKARLVGSSEVLHGRVIHVADPGAVHPNTVGAASRDAVAFGSFRAIIALEEPPTGGNRANRYHIGSAAIVWADRGPWSTTGSRIPWKKVHVHDTDGRE